jgi:hypothetical protein
VFLELEYDVDLTDNCLILELGKSYTVTFEAKPGKVSVLDQIAA